MSLNAGKTLRAIRERLTLRFRDVSEASRHIAANRKNPNFTIGLSRLADIENRNTVPSIYRLYSLAAIYGMDYGELLALYGVELAQMPRDAVEISLHGTRPIRFAPAKHAAVNFPLKDLLAADLATTTHLSHLKAWGTLPLQFLDSFSDQTFSYALVGTEDWSMYPLVPPGSFVQIDESRRKVANSGWENDFSRPIYFLELRTGYRLGWCTETSGALIIQPHPAAPKSAEIVKFPEDVEVIGQVVAVAMRLDRAMQRRKRSLAAQV